MYDELKNDYKIQEPLLNMTIIVYIVLIILGIVGNSFVIYLVIFNGKLRNVRNAFMLNLTFTNLLLLTICTPSYLLSLIFTSWIHGSFWCKFSHSIQIVFVLVCAFSIMMIAIDRWMFVVYARSKHFKSTDATIIIIVMWLVAIFLASPTFFYREITRLYDDSFKQFLIAYQTINVTDLLDHSKNNRSMNITVLSPTRMENNNQTYINNQKVSSVNVQAESILKELQHFQNNIVYCFEEWPHPTYKRTYILILFVLEFVLPCTTLLVTYIWIIKFLKDQDNKMNHYELLHKRLIQKERPHQKNCKLLSALCLTFIICYLPLSLFNIEAEFHVKKFLHEHTNSNKEQVYLLLTLLTTLEVLNTVLSPLLYGWMNQNFRTEIKKKFLFYKCKLDNTNNIMEQKSLFDIQTKSTTSPFTKNMLL
jgi:hypothetical protein